MTKSIDFIVKNDDGTETQKTIVISDSASWIIRFESEFKTSFSKLSTADKDTIPMDLGLRLSYAMLKPKASVPYEDWIDRLGIDTSAMAKISSACMDFFASTTKNV